MQFNYLSKFLISEPAEHSSEKYVKFAMEISEGKMLEIKTVLNESCLAILMKETLCINIENQNHPHGNVEKNSNILPLHLQLDLSDYFYILKNIEIQLTNSYHLTVSKEDFSTLNLDIIMEEFKSLEYNFSKIRKIIFLNIRKIFKNNILPGKIITQVRG